MIRKNLYILLIIAPFIFSCFSCNTFGANTKTIDVNGMIYDFANKPVAYCDISIGDLYTGSTDINGRFTLPKIPPETYIISAFKEGYEIYSDEITIRDQGQIVYIRIPSQMQLLSLVDDALTMMNFDIAEEYIQRAYHIDRNNIEMLFYYATVKFRQGNYTEAIGFLTIAKNLGSKDTYIDRFLTVLEEFKYE